MSERKDWEAHLIIPCISLSLTSFLIPLSSLWPLFDREIERP